MPDEIYNAIGDVIVEKRDSMSPTKQSYVSQTDRRELSKKDDNLIRDAEYKKSQGDMMGAQADVGNIRDPDKRMEAYKDLFGDNGMQDPPSGLYKDGSGGVEDPLALFFMMVFYLDKPVPSFNWADVLATASASASSKNSNLNFGNINPDTAFLPQSKLVNAPVTTPQPIVTTNPNAPVAPDRRQTFKEKEAKNKKAFDENQKSRDSDKKPVPASNTAPDASKGVSSTLVWPIQNMPIISGGFNKTVEWPYTNQIPTMAEPMLAINNGGSAIEIDIEFTYAVGIAGIGDHPNTVSVAQGAGSVSKTDEERWWTVEEVMGMMYLAESLVFPFISTPVNGKDVLNVGESATQLKNELKEGKGASQFPVVFLRHYSLFPFLTPFVVKGVKIEPDENQPLLITERNALNNVDTHLSYPAVRQVVKITLSMSSAHYYLPAFGNRDQGGQLQKQTSGKTYLGLGSTLLKGRV